MHKNAPPPDTPPTASQRTAARIRAQMSHDKRTHAELAQHLGISIWSVSRRLNGHHDFKLDELERIAAFLQVPLEFITLDEAKADR